MDGSGLEDLDQMRKNRELYYTCTGCGWEGISTNKLHLLGICPRCEEKNLEITAVVSHLDQPITLEK